ncbi:hypothetical protein [Oceanobacillus oncorhynchi]|uniref:hypothetical protein n=1 Tax=Oceanobacillus oncorhynchi TaxID=545501 RepID=UPI0034D5F7FD
MFLYEYVFNTIIKLPGKDPFEKAVAITSDKGHKYAANQAKQFVLGEEKLTESDVEYVRVEFRSSQIKNYM